MTLEVLVRRHHATGSEQVLRQTISQTVDRVHVTTGDGREWLFERNVRDPRRVSGAMVDHASKAIVVHDESDLRSRLGVRGWIDMVAVAGVDTSLPKQREAGFSIHRLRKDVDPAVLQSPAVRFPDYRVLDLADWLERRDK